MASTAFAGAVLATSASGWVSLVEMGSGRMHAPVCGRTNGEVVLCGDIQHRWGRKVIVGWSRRLRGGAAKVGMRVRLGGEGAPNLTETNHEVPRLVLINEAASFLFGISNGKALATNDGDVAEDLFEEWQLWIGANSLSAVVCLQGSVSNHLALGVGFSFQPLSTQGLTSKLFGAKAAAHYFPGELWEGLWFQAGAGFFTGRSTYGAQSGSQSGPSFVATAGWRQRFKGWNLGLAAGLNYVQLSPTSRVSFTYKSVTPTIWVDFGFFL